MISFENVSLAYGDKKVLKNINFLLKESESVVILGENGVGKSTIAKAMTGLLHPEGKITLFGEDISRMSHKKRALLINYIPSKLDIFDDSVTLGEYVLLGRYPYKERFEAYSSSEIKEADSLLDELGFKREEESAVGFLSSGQKQLAMIAQAVMQKSRITIFDEPVSNLDPLNAKKIFDIIKKSPYFQTKIVITHDMNFAHSLGYKIIYIRAGEIVYFGGCKEFFSQEKLDENFGGCVLKSARGIAINYA